MIRGSWVVMQIPKVLHFHSISFRNHFNFTTNRKNRHNNLENVALL
jgi:hypothetical protein